jgi:hypothetical protein
MRRPDAAVSTWTDAPKSVNVMLASGTGPWGGKDELLQSIR